MATVDRMLDPSALGDHVDRLYRAAWAMSGSRMDAEDLVQETFARVLAKPRRIRNEDDIGYLLQVLRNVFISSRRERSTTRSTRRTPARRGGPRRQPRRARCSP